MILPIVRKVVYIYTKQGSGLKKSNLGHFPMRKWPTKWLLRLYKWKKIVRIMGFMVVKSSGSDSRFQRKNRFWKICTESQDITKKVSKIGLPNQTSKIWHILADISGLGAYFSKPIFALKPWVRAGRFEYHEPHNPNDFFFTYKGVRAILSAISSSENGPNSNFWVQILV